VNVLAAKRRKNMAKVKPITIENNAAADSGTKAKTEFDEYKKKMDEYYAKETVNKQHFIPAPPDCLGFQPAYVFTSPHETHYGHNTAPMDTETQSSQKHDTKDASILDSLTRLLELSIKTINVSLTGGVAVMNRFYGLGERECSNGNESSKCCSENRCDCECDGYSQHHECCCNDCHPSVGNCH
jgi:hypothetical protein